VGNGLRVFTLKSLIFSGGWTYRVDACPSQSREGRARMYLAFLGAIKAGLVRTMGKAVTVLRQASKARCFGV
jgi:hypothetical protein